MAWSFAVGQTRGWSKNKRWYDLQRDRYFIFFSAPTSVVARVLKEIMLLYWTELLRCRKNCARDASCLDRFPLSQGFWKRSVFCSRPTCSVVARVLKEKLIFWIGFPCRRSLKEELPLPFWIGFPCRRRSERGDTTFFWTDLLRCGNSSCFIFELFENTEVRFRCLFLCVTISSCSGTKEEEEEEEEEGKEEEGSVLVSKKKKSRW